MTRRVLVGVGVAAAVAVAWPAAAFTTRDMLGRDITLAAPPTRIVSLVPSVTEIVYALVDTPRGAVLGHGHGRVPAS